MKKGQIELKLQSYDVWLLQSAVATIIDELKKRGIDFKGPIRLPKKTNKITIKRSTHIYKEANESYRQDTHKVLIYILSNSPEVMEGLSKINLVSSVNISIKI